MYQWYTNCVPFPRELIENDYETTRKSFTNLFYRLTLHHSTRQRTKRTWRLGKGLLIAHIVVFGRVYSVLRSAVYSRLVGRQSATTKTLLFFIDVDALIVLVLVFSYCIFSLFYADSFLIVIFLVSASFRFMN